MHVMKKTAGWLINILLTTKPRQVAFVILWQLSVCGAYMLISLYNIGHVITALQWTLTVMMISNKQAETHK